MTEELEFFDELPALVSGRQVQVVSRLEQIKTRPGKWAKWPSAGTTEQKLRKSIESMRLTGFDVGTGSLNGKKFVFVRFTAPEVESSPQPDPPPVPQSAGAWTIITCPGCSVPLSVPINEIGAAKASHRKRNPTCDAIIKRRRNGW
jgi:hypothetical protein